MGQPVDALVSRRSWQARGLGRAGTPRLWRSTQRTRGARVSGTPAGAAQLMIEIPIEDEVQRGVWEFLLDLHHRQPHGWTLIGAQMVALHGYEHGRPPPRRSRDA